MVTERIAPTTRPNGKVYRPRKLTGHVTGDYDDGVSGVVVFGTHDPDVARPHAEQVIRDWTTIWGNELGMTVAITTPERTRLEWWRPTIYGHDDDTGLITGHTADERATITGRPVVIFDAEEVTTGDPTPKAVTPWRD